MLVKPLAAMLALTLLTPLAHAAPVDDGWLRVQHLAPGTRIHIAADAGSTTCKLRSADETSVSCAGAHGKAFPRSTIRSIKLTRYLASTAAGLGIGAGVGGLVGVAAIRPKPHEFLNFSAIGRAFFAVGGGLNGAAIMGATDTFRGPTLYARPRP